MTSTEGQTLDQDRSLTEADVKAIVSELKTQLVQDFQIEVGKGVLGWVKKALFYLLLLAAVAGAFGSGWFKAAFNRIAGNDKPVLPAIVGKAAMRAAGIMPRGFTVIPPHDTPDDMLAMAAEIERLNGEKA